jgi:hypothetical protein
MNAWKISGAIIATALAALPSSSLALPPQSPVIQSVRLYTDGHYLLCDVTSTGLLGDRIAGTVRSGLPAVVELFYHLKSRGFDSSVKGIQSWSLRYDVWEDIYSVSDGDTTVTLNSIESMENMISRLDGISLVPFSRLAKGRTFTVRFSIAVNPLSGTRGELVEGWIEESGENRQESTWREQVLNIGDLISHFFSKDRGAASRSAWFETAGRRPEELPVRERGE